MISSNDELFQKLRKTDVITENFSITKAKYFKGFYLKPLNEIFKCKYIYLEFKGLYVNGTDNYLYVLEVKKDRILWQIGWYNITTSDKFIKKISDKLK
jgi:hypothetical protein